MTAKSELFIEEVMGEILEANPKLKGVRIEYDTPKGWLNIWNEADYPNKGNMPLFAYNKQSDKTPVYIADVEWDVKFSIDDFGYGKSISAEPENVRLIKNENWEKVMVVGKKRLSYARE